MYICVLTCLCFYIFVLLYVYVFPYKNKYLVTHLDLCIFSYFVVWIELYLNIDVNIS